VKNNSALIKADMRLLDFHQTRPVTTSPTLYLAGKFGEDRWRIAISRAFNSCCVTD